MSTWSELSNELSNTVQEIGKGVIALQAEGTRTVSGIVFDDRTIVNSASVISDGEKIRAWISRDQQVDASVIGRDRGTDIALLKPDQPLTPSEERGDAGRVRWVSGAPGKPPAYAGTDFLVARDGRIAALYLFFDKLP